MFEKFEFENRLLFYAGFGFMLFVLLVATQIAFQRFLIHNQLDNADSSLLSFLYYFTLAASSSLAYVFYIRYVGQHEITFNLVVRIVVICISASVAVYVNDVLRITREKYAKLLSGVRLQENNSEEYNGNHFNRYIEFISEKGSDYLRILVSDILYLRSADNYVEICFMDGDETKKTLVRNTLKNIERQLTVYTNFIRTHRTAIVNIQFIERLHKEFNTYWLSLDNTEETIPVSRLYLVVVKDMLSKLRDE